jgi:DNA-binding response OmpR family regulator
MARILLVDDDSGIRSLLTLVLEREGFDVIVTDSAEAALAGARSHKVDLLLTDVSMPGASGHEIARRVRELQPDSSVLLMSGSPEYLEMGRVPPSTALIEKPFDPMALVSCIRALLRRRGNTHLGRTA